MTKWTIIPTSNSPTPRFDFSLSHHGRHMYLFGGNEGNVSTNFSAFQKLDLAGPAGERSWIKVESQYDQGQARDGHCSVVVGNEMYVIGGSQTLMSGRLSNIQSVYFNFMSIYNFETNEWRRVTSPTLGRLGSAVYYERSEDKKYIYVFGGYESSSRPNADLWQYDIINERWRLVPFDALTFPGERYGHSANIFENKMYIYGGYSKKGFLRDFYALDLDTETWSQIETEGPPKRRRHAAAIIEHNGRTSLLLYGGTYTSCYYNDLWEYVFPPKVHIPDDSLQSDFSTLFDNAVEYLSDVAFIVEDRPIHVHRNILAIRSSYFKSLFTVGMKESFQKEITVTGEKYDDFNSLLRYIYTGDKTLITLENCIGLLHLADRYMMPRLLSICEAKVFEGIEHDNVVALFRQADFYKLPKLRQHCLSYIAKNHKDVLATGTLNDLESSVLLEIMYCLDPSLKGHN
eukprot:gene14028-16535_t